MLIKMTLLFVGVIVQSPVMVGRAYPQERKEPRRVSVCDVFEGSFPSVRGVVAIRGVATTVLRDERCPEPVEIQGDKWPRSIDAISTKEGLGAEWRLPGDLTLTELVVRNRVVSFGHLKPLAVEAVFVGELRYKDRYDRQPSKGGGTARRPAFGQFGEVPVQLEVYAVRDIKVLDKKP